MDIAVALTDTDGSETITDITVSGVPSGAQLSAGTDNLDGTWTLTPADLAGLTVTPAADSDADFTLSVSATSAETDGGSATTVASLDVTVTGVADVPSVTVADAAGAEDSAIALDITAVLTDVDGSETITDVTISGVPLGAQLSAGTDNLDGTWTLTPADLAGLTVTPAADSDADFTLSVSATSTEAEGDAATTISNLDITVAGVADVPTVTVAPATGAEDQAIALDIGVALNDIDGSETITDITVSGVPSGAQLSAGTDNLDGTWTLTPADLAGLTVTPPADSDADFTLTVSATSTEAEGDSATTLANLDVTVTGVADVPTVTVAPATGAEDTAIPLDITAALADTDGSETLGITIAAVPLGAILSAGTDNGDGTWTLTGAELFGLTITQPAESADDFTLGITVTATDEGGDTATTTASIDVAVTAVADAPTLDLDSSAAGAQLEDTVQGTAGDEIPLDMSAGLTDTDLSETLSITISGVPEGATLSAGFDNGDGSWTLTGDDLAGLTITSPDAADFELSVSAHGDRGRRRHRDDNRHHYRRVRRHRIAHRRR